MMSRLWKNLAKTGLVILAVLGLMAEVQAQSILPTSTASDVLAPGVSVDSQGADQTAAASIDATRSRYGTYARAIVREIKHVPTDQANGSKQRIKYLLEILSGERKGQNLEAVYDVALTVLNPEVGDRLIVFYQADANQAAPKVFLESYDRQSTVSWLMVLLLAICLIVAGSYGVRIFVAMGAAAIIGQFMLVPLYLHGWSPLVCFLVSVAVLAAAYSLLILGISKRAALAALAGTLGSAMVYAIIEAFTLWSSLTPNFDATANALFRDNVALDPMATVTLGASWLVAALVLGLACSIVDGVARLKQINPNWSFKEAFAAGMTLGYERVANIAPVLLAAAAGFGFLVMVATNQTDAPWMQKMNTNDFTVLLIPMLSGALGLVLSVPAIAATAAASWSNAVKKLDPLRSVQSWRPDDINGPTDPNNA